jgi:coiled-coil and C2 domain-containing protein 2A
LCNYCLFLEKRAWIVVGRTSSSDKALYVLVDESEKQVLIDPVSSCQYNLDDVHCPLKDIGFMFNDENVWANIQIYDIPCQMVFDVQKKLCWTPFFTKQMRNKISRNAVVIQRPVLNYNETEISFVKDIQQNLKRQLLTSIEEWRGRFTTKWNR